MQSNFNKLGQPVNDHVWLTTGECAMRVGSDAIVRQALKAEVSERGDLPFLPSLKIRNRVFITGRAFRVWLEQCEVSFTNLPEALKNGGGA